jgi:small GTP-binding protein
LRTAKVCIIGDFAVGKTSTIARFVNNEFSEKYLTTVGVKIDTKIVETNAGPLKLVIWDVAGTDRFTDIEFAYLRGSAGYLLVADGTRPDTLNSALNLHTELKAAHGALPFVALVNKSDLSEQWQIDDDVLADYRRKGIDWMTCSAKTGTNVASAIEALGAAIAQSETG